jgi:hypothetical protein
MSLSKQNYVAIAKVIQEAKKRALRQKGIRIGAAGYASLHEAQEALANYFAQDNPNFDRGRFLAACEPA